MEKAKKLWYGVLALAMAAMIILLVYGIVQTKLQKSSVRVPEMIPGVIVSDADDIVVEPAMRTWTLEQSGAGEALVRTAEYVKPLPPKPEPLVFEDFFYEDGTAFGLKRYLGYVGVSEVETQTIYLDPAYMSVTLASGDEVQVTLVGDLTIPQIVVIRPDGRAYRADLKGEGQLILVDDVHEKYVHEDTLWTLAEVVERLPYLSEQGCPFAEIGVTHWEYPIYDVRIQSLHED
ncbi:hypothetical protein IJG66_00155 [Candidatus Saccharibacteria bacterium]|nr:hypothetical protein [Candidatus Saccharibacteria bacterium]